MVEADRMRVSVIGTGYLGATTAACLAEMGFEVLGLDVDDAKIDMLRSGRVPFFEPGLEELLTANLGTGRLHFTTSFAEAAEFADLHLICVGTPQRDDSGAADLRYVNAAVDQLAPHLTRPTVVVGRSTVPVGTAATLAARLSALAPVGEEAELGWSPEFLREGFGVEDTLHPNRIVIGTDSPRVEKAVRALWQRQIDDGVPFLLTDLQTAELVKVSANAFLATKISFINAMAEVSEVAGADVIQLAEALSYDDRIGGKFLGPGLGFGGGCLPKDIRAFMARADELGVEPALSFLREVDAINQRRRARTIDIARQLIGGSFAGRTVTVLGAAFKPNSDDIRDSPALDVASTIASLGAQVTVYDPRALERAREAHPELNYADSMLAAARGADVVLLLTEWAEFREANPEELAGVVARKRIVDGRNALDPTYWRASGWTYRALGRQ
ncbi:MULTISPECIES: UDP-glucose/GDP-mannose dehydrogenase family protein [Nocardiopsis]|uniref:UDP-glucose 6-dehydrogenase n=1 Tax=Nocardiopsis akebiae TaxID=2831968 RepID=A0ABX8C6L5_9ACTN|nr:MULTISPECIES: UDP-glucose/GDP-mannose dehydrogenase family protein [Nocardiopsis]MCK9870738.1 UDP-glucose/GDP-mannose dehydrogenase family protein [Nocardiopsis dassonvillei]QUX30065.1 UDP-glucose/GDP-mannose dehydrogenase family protein [Nocardiopsis akebiae]WDZ89956.1 UDP-glucose/GDP-mannose dehydrogenase family protein [Nocardiopsis sp. HUAS JQ3]